jgi:GNAT superfamily N-acetyltransferase
LNPAFQLRPLTPADKDWVDRFIEKEWGAKLVVAHGVIFRPSELPGYTATMGEAIDGLVTYNIMDTECEIVTLNSCHENLGIGSALIKAVQRTAADLGSSRLFLVTTNNNLHALHFYQKRGFVLSALRVNAIIKSRILKPEIPLEDEDGIPIRDEIELEIGVNQLISE